MTDEVWKTCAYYPDHEVSTHGRIRKNGKIKNLKPRKQGYIRVGMDTMAGRRKGEYLHRLILLTFVGEPESDDLEACHNDGVKTNCKLDNLRWDTKSSNTKDYWKHRDERAQSAVASLSQ